MKSAAAIALVAVGLFAAPVQAQGRPDIDITKLGIFYKIDGMDQVRVVADQAFRSGGIDMKYDMYAPPAPVGRRPAIVFVSGASEVRNWQWFKDYGRLAAAHGFVGFVPDKRYPPNAGGVGTALADTQAFVEHIASNANALGIDPNRICLWIFSAGGRMAGLPYQADGPDIRCLVAYYGVMAIRSPTGETNNAGSLAKYSPEQAVAAPGARKVATFVARAGKDAAPLNASIERFVDAAVAADVPLTFVNYPAGEHGFDGINDTEESRRIVASTFAFIRDAVRD